MTTNNNVIANNVSVELPKKTTKVFAEYKVESFWEIKGDLEKAYYYDIRNDILTIVWKEGDKPIEYEPTEPAVDEYYENFRDPDNIYVEEDEKQKDETRICHVCKDVEDQYYEIWSDCCRCYQPKCHECSVGCDLCKTCFVKQ